MTDHKGLSEPPEGALVGESVPRENEEEDRYEQKVQEAVGIMKTMPAYQDLSDDELRERAEERMKEVEIE